ncbi:hypothetical protein L4D06_05685 [Enterovibrio makurazakiensis]|uniref:hypothetical protein n=1 Tax=Enterovibrio makurazakiensis TaxID=2910232 RepID=UPI003D221370
MKPIFMRQIVKWSLIHAAFIGINLIVLLVFTLSVGFSGNVPEFVSFIAKLWAGFVELLMFPMSSVISHLNESDMLNSEGFFIFLYALNSVIWGTMIAVTLKVTTRSNPE